uniref:CCHC-type domain-containing protein n=1 Tax=Nicotiana tabacum TaxID=4097 RepID=A0A1S3Z597_TOBAC
MTTSAEQQNGSAAMATASSNRTTPAPAEKPEKFFGVEFKRWQQKMFFYLTTLSLQRFISEDVPVLGEETPENERFVVTEKYKTEDAGLKMFVAAKFLDFKIVDDKSVITQVQELQVIAHDLLVEGMIINEAFQVATFMEKLPPLWKDFKNYLKHKRKEMTLEDLIVRLWIEEDYKAAEKKSRGNSTIMGVNIVKEALTSKKRKKSSGPKNYPSKKKFKRNCHNCEKVGHKAAECRAPKKDKELFTSYAPAGPNENFFMANSATVKIEGTGKIALKMTSGKIVTLNDVLHVSEMRKNLVSTSLLVKNGFKYVFISDKVVVSKNEIVSRRVWPSNPSDGCKDSLLNGDLEEEIYMEQPEGFVVSGNEKK